MKVSLSAAFLLAVLLLISGRGTAMAHCDAVDGPVVITAKKALEKGDVTPVLKWVTKEHEQDIRDLFGKTRLVRTKGKDARELADHYFFETLVRVHRAGEGAPYTGLKPAGHVGHAIAEADKAIETGKLGGLVGMLTEAAAAGLRRRYEAVQETRKHADDSVEAGRKFVAAYVDFTHYVEGLDKAAAMGGHHEMHAGAAHKEAGSSAKPAEAPSKHEH